MWKILEGDCVEQMRGLPERSVDAVVCDPPYALNFMGKEWDSPAAMVGQAPNLYGGLKSGSATGYGETAKYSNQFQQWCEVWAAEALRVLKPGGHLLAFGGTRTYHRLTSGIEDAGFEIRDCLAWLYGSGFPKSLDVSKAIDKAAGAEREVIGTQRVPDALKVQPHFAGYKDVGDYMKDVPVTAPATEEAQRWDGWGTALKPAHEPIVLARKPFKGTVAACVLEHGTGAVNVDGCRIGMSDEDREAAKVPQRDRHGFTSLGDGGGRSGEVFAPAIAGRWPANVLLDADAAAQLDEQTGETVSRPAAMALPSTPGDSRGQAHGDNGTVTMRGHDDAGGASRFFYTAKTSSAERNAGLAGFEEVEHGAISGANRPHEELDPLSARFASRQRNVHPTVKPIELMRWLVRLVTPPGGVVLDPFTGSGSTGCAVVLEECEFIGIERDAEYLPICKARIAWWEKHAGEGAAAELIAAGAVRDTHEAAGQDRLF